MNPSFKKRSFSLQSSVDEPLVNFRVAKRKFSFQKQERFIPILKITTPTDFTSNLGSTFSTKAAGFGFGERFKSPNRDNCKFQYTQKHSNILVMTPAPHDYKIKTCFEGASPFIRNNTITTSFKNQSARNSFNKGFIPGDR